jgi:diguanylate cyclase (GGDEF)-like protein
MTTTTDQRADTAPDDADDADDTDDARTKARPGTARVYALAAVVTIAAVAITAGPLHHTTTPGTLHLPWPLLAAAFAASEAFLIHLEHRREAVSLSLSAIPLVVGLYTVDPTWLVVARVVGSAAALMLHRKQVPMKLVVNLSHMALEVATAIAVFHALAPDGYVGVATWPAAVVAAIVSDAVQSLVLVAAISLYNRRWEVGIGSSMAIGSAARLVDTSVALVIVSVLKAEPAAVGLLGIACTVLGWSYRVHTSLREQHRHLEQLYDFTRRMNDAVLAERVVDTVLEEAKEVLHADDAWLDLFDRNQRAPWLHELVQRANRPILLSADDDARLTDLGVAQVVAGPLRDASSGAIGTLVVADRSGDVRPFDGRDLRLFATLANHAGVALANHDLVERLRVQSAAHEHTSLHDPLTGLPNRTLFARRVEEAIAERTESLAVLLLDLDRFKEVNDTLGHQHGDVLLQEVAQRLRRTLRHGDTIARLGGDEFAVLLPDVPGAEAALVVAKALVGALEQPFAVADLSVDIAASIGMAMAPGNGSDPAALLRHADVAMYVAKANQTGVEAYDDERDPHSAERLALVGELRQAIADHTLEVHYQPQVSLTTGAVIGVESLVRWRHPVHGWLPPDEFVPMAERTGLIRPLTTLVLDTALREIARWRTTGGPARVSVNLSARSLLDGALVDDVRELLRNANVPPAALCLELTETSVLLEPRRTIATLRRLADLGVTIAIDDFGTGQSSLAYLKTLPVGEIKVDKSFVLGMTTDPSDEAIVCSIVQLATNLEIPVVAEGVETAELADRLRAIGCGFAQGYGISRPLATADLTRWLTDRTPPPQAPPKLKLRPLPQSA